MQSQAFEDNAAAESRSMVPRPTRFNLAIYLLFTRLCSIRHFQSLRIANLERMPENGGEGPLVVFINHASWWDPLPILLLQLKLMPERVAYAPSDAEGLRKASSLRRVGSFPVATGTLSGTKTFIRDCRHVLSIPDAVLFVTPQGEFTDARMRPLKLRRGLAALLAKMDHVTVLPLAVEYTFWGDAKPEILASWGEPIQMEPGRSVSIAEWQEALTTSLTTTMDELAEISIRREHWRFRNIVYGRMGKRNILELIADIKTVLRRNA